MSEIPESLLYTSEHEWIREEDDGVLTVGVTDHAQESLGDVTFVELPDIGQSFERNAVFGVVESVKAASDLFMPVSGEIVATNDGLNDSPEKVNDDPYQEGWMIKVKASEDSVEKGLLDAAGYAAEIS
ncbi:MAG TPA: glycine cleavage system protein GcvH [Opitutae bacterium]|nr:glycine cleavage system protein GcvH [Opitutae bacterium]|tara:strand:+ start:783 stop:1166 length:384 start_codon:yes stop_codon:yes gene_type:complete